MIVLTVAIKQDWQCTYQLNSEARSRERVSRGEAITITYTT